MAKNKIAQERLPHFEMVIDENDNETGINFLSIVKDPAIEIKGHIFNSETDIEEHTFKRRVWQKRKGEIKRGQSADVGYTPPCHDNCQCEITDTGEWITGAKPCAFCKNNQQYYYDNSFLFDEHIFSVQKDQQIIVGPAMIPDIKIDRLGENGIGPHTVSFSVDTIKQCVAKFIKNNNNNAIDFKHSHKLVKAFIMEHWIIRDSVFDASNTYGFKNLPVGTWFVVMKIDDTDFWEQQVKGEQLQSFSIDIDAGMKHVKFSANIDLESVLESLTDDELMDILKGGFTTNNSVKG